MIAFVSAKSTFCISQNKMFGPFFKFHSNLHFCKSTLKKLLPFYRNTWIGWSQDISESPETSPQILSQFLLCNIYVEIEGTLCIFQNSLIKILTSYRGYLKIAGSHLGSILKIDMNLQMTCFSVCSTKTCNSCEMEKTNFFSQWC